MTGKKVLVWGMLLSLLCSLAACGQGAPKPAETEASETTDVPETEAPTEPLMSHEEYLGLIREAIAPAQGTIAAGLWHAAAVRPDGSVLYTGENQGHREEAKNFTNMKSISCKGFHYISGVTRDGKAVLTPHDPLFLNWGQDSISTWEDMAQFDCNGYISAGVKADGTALAAGGVYFSRWKGSETVKELEGCKKVIGFSLGMLAALTQEGTVTFLTRNPYDSGEQYTWGTESWDGIVDLVADNNMFVGLREDGTVLTGGLLYSDAEECYFEVPKLDWTDIVAVDISAPDIVGLRADGKVCYANAWDLILNREPDPRFLETETWEDIAAVSIGNSIMGLKADGTVLACGYPKDLVKEVSTWKLGPIEVPRDLPHQDAQIRN